jgi:folate-dependent phosphoribosylglycinamide formyltransferase PurN
MHPKIALITGPDLRHRYFVHRLNQEFPIECVVIEDVIYPDFHAGSVENQTAWDWFFSLRKEYEERTFADANSCPPLNQPKVIHVSSDRINSREFLKTLQAQRPDVIILFGCSLIGRDILKSFPNRILNLHIGISGQYRGSSCNFWPIHDERLECLGATVLTVNSGIDSGEILAQEIIDIEQGDSVQTLMGKTVICGVNLTIQVIRQGLVDKEKPLPLKRNGKLFLKRDFTPKAINKVKDMEESGHLKTLIGEYLQTRS